MGLRASRLKGKKGSVKRDHVVPLCDRALQIVRDLPASSIYLFAADDGEPLSNMAMLEVLRGMGFGGDLTVHGFRSTSRTGAQSRLPIRTKCRKWCWRTRCRIRLRPHTAGA